jgi:hypothetical protein
MKRRMCLAFVLAIGAVFSATGEALIGSQSTSRGQTGRTGTAGAQCDLSRFQQIANWYGTLEITGSGGGQTADSSWTVAQHISGNFILTGGDDTWNGAYLASADVNDMVTTSLLRDLPHGCVPMPRVVLGWRWVLDERHPLLLRDEEMSAAVLLPARFVLVVTERLLLAFADNRDAIPRHAEADEIRLHGGRALQSERKILFDAAPRVAASFDRDPGARPPFQPVCIPLEQYLAVAWNL